VATKRKRKASWEYVVRRKDVLQRPLYLTFSTEAEGDQYVKRLEALLDAGIVPEEFRRRQGELTTIEDAARAYLAVQHVPVSDTRCLAIVVERVRGTRLSAINYEWVESWVVAMKRERNLSPSTIRHHVGALARCIDWCVRRGDVGVVINPLRLLPKLFLFNEDEMVPELRAQRQLNKARLPEMARYVLENPDDYVFSAITASVDADVIFEPFGDDPD